MVLAGVIFGTLILNIVLGFKGSVLVEQVEYYHRLVQSQLEPSILLFLRICIYRMGVVIVLLACIRLTGNYHIFYPFMFLLGVAFGYTLSLLCFCYGFSGILCMAAYLFPQYFIYIPLIIIILRETSSQMDRTFAPDFRRTVVFFSIILLGCGAESYINPFVLKIILKNFF